MLQPAELSREFDSYGSAYQWATPRSGYLRGSHPDDVKFLFRDNLWSVLADVSLCMSADQHSLEELSRRLGRVVVATTQGTAGFAQLLVLEGGTTIRSIARESGPVVETGAPLPEEDGASWQTFYLDELEGVWRRFGLFPFLQTEPMGRAVALHVVDRTPYPEQQAATPSVPPGTARRPWWKFW
jgi:hypothetical protein